MRRRTLVTMLSLSPVFAAGVARADELGDIRKAGVIRVATSLSVAPYNYTDGSMQPAGSDVDTARLLAQDLGVKLELVSTTVPARIPTLQSGKADVVISVLAITPERREVIDFSAPYSVNSNVVIAPKSVAISSWGDLSGKVIGLTRGTSEDKAVTENAKGAQIRRYEDWPTVVTAMVSGQVKIAAGTPSSMKTMNEASGADYEQKFVIEVTPLGIGLRKGNPEFKAWLDKWVADNLANGKLNAIYRKSIGVDLPVADLAAGR